MIRLIIKLPLAFLIPIGQTIGCFLFLVQKKQKKISETNIARYFPELNEKDRKHLLFTFYQSMGLGYLEIGLAWWANASLPKHLRFYLSGSPYLTEALERKKGVIILFCHQIILELAGRLLSSKISLSAVYRPSKNPLLNYLMYSGRKPLFKNLILKHQVKTILKLLKTNQMVAIAPDQNLSAAFSGIPSDNMVAIIRMAQITGAAIIPIDCYREIEDKTYHLKFLPPLDPCLSNSPCEEAKKICAFLKQTILQHPEQYLWLKRKVKPPKGKVN